MLFEFLYVLYVLKFFDGHHYRPCIQNINGLKIYWSAWSNEAINTRILQALSRNKNCASGRQSSFICFRISVFKQDLQAFYLSLKGILSLFYVCRHDKPLIGPAGIGLYTYVYKAPEKNFWGIQFRAKRKIPPPRIFLS